MKNLSCAREGCQVSSTDKCLEGFEPPITCPYLASAPVSGGEAAATEPSAFVDLPSGEGLTEVQASEVTRQGVTRVVVLAGPSGSGKTTILTSLSIHSSKLLLPIFYLQVPEPWLDLKDDATMREWHLAARTLTQFIQMWTHLISFI